MPVTLFFPNENGTAIALQWHSEMTFQDYSARVTEDISIYHRIAKNPQAEHFLAHQFPYGISLNPDVFILSAALMYTSTDFITQVFIDSIDFDEGRLYGKSGYGPYHSYVQPETVRINYRLDQTVFLFCVTRDNNDREEALDYTLPFAKFIEYVDVLVEKSL